MIHFVMFTLIRSEMEILSIFMHALIIRFGLKLVAVQVTHVHEACT